MEYPNPSVRIVSFGCRGVFRAHRSRTTPTANLFNGRVDEVLTRSEASGTSNYMADGLGNTMALVDGTGSIQTQYTYEAFGQTATTGSGSTNQRLAERMTVQNFIFTDEPILMI